MALDVDVRMLVGIGEDQAAVDIGRNLTERQKSLKCSEPDRTWRADGAHHRAGGLSQSVSAKFRAEFVIVPSQAVSWSPGRGEIPGYGVRLLQVDEKYNCLTPS